MHSEGVDLATALQRRAKLGEAKLLADGFAAVTDAISVELNKLDAAINEVAVLEHGITVRDDANDVGHWLVEHLPAFAGYLEMGKPIQAIKLVRFATGLPLRDAKAVVDSVRYCPTCLLAV